MLVCCFYFPADFLSAAWFGSAEAWLSTQGRYALIALLAVLVHCGTTLCLELAGGMLGNFCGLSDVLKRVASIRTLGEASLLGSGCLLAGDTSSKVLEDDIRQLLLSFLLFSIFLVLAALSAILLALLGCSGDGGQATNSFWL